MKPYRLVLLLAVWLGAAAAHADSLASIFTNADTRPIPPRRTSIIYIQCHGLGYGDLSCYGQTNYQTPNLDKLAAEGIRFMNYRSGASNFTDALAMLVTGKKSASGETRTLAEQLQVAGYATGLIGEWTLDNHPWTRGFEEFGGFLDGTAARNYYADSLWHFDPHYSYDPASNQWVDWHPGQEPHNAAPEMIYENTAGRHGKYMPELLFTMLLNFVDNHTPDFFNHYQPFFVVLNLPVPQSAAAGEDVYPVPSDAPFTEQPWPQAAKNRAALITRLDGDIGRLFDKFKSLGISNNVAIFFTSSAAPEPFKDPNLNFLAPNGTARAGDKGLLPMIVRWPEKIPAGQVSEFKWTGLDFMPTAVEMSYAKQLTDLDGMSILPILQGLRERDGKLGSPRNTPQIY